MKQHIDRLFGKFAGFSEQDLRAFRLRGLLYVGIAIMFGLTIFFLMLIIF